VLNRSLQDSAHDHAHTCPKKIASGENAVLSVSARAVTTNHVADSTLIADAPHRSSRWQRFVNALYKTRMWSAHREIERHADAILFWHRGLAERRAYLRPVAHPSTFAPKNDVSSRLAAN
jgi:hypothetical protein